jgi:hypothetical protein
MRKLVLVLAILLCIPLANFLVRALSLWTTFDCTKENLGSIISPDGKLEARAVSFLCGSPLTGNTGDFTVIVLVQPGHDPSSDGTVMKIGLDWEEWRLIHWPSQMEWKSARYLEVILPESARIWDRKSTASGVTVEVKHTPNNASARRIP